MEGVHSTYRTYRDLESRGGRLALAKMPPAAAADSRGKTQRKKEKGDAVTREGCKNTMKKKRQTSLWNALPYPPRDKTEKIPTSNEIVPTPTTSFLRG